MSPENTHKLMGFYMEVLHYALVHGFCYSKWFPIGLTHVSHNTPVTTTPGEVNNRLSVSFKLSTLC